MKMNARKRTAKLRKETRTVKNMAEAPKPPQILVIDLGSQTTLLISKRLAEMHLRSAVLPPDKAAAWLKDPINKRGLKGIILSGSGYSVYQPGAIQPPAGILDLENDGNPVPVLGICYGMQWMANALKGSVKSRPGSREYGGCKIAALERTGLLANARKTLDVWASHGDIVARVPKTFRITARTASGDIAAMADKEDTLFGVQFHPEATHSGESGKLVLYNFAFNACKCARDWRPTELIGSIQEKAKADLGSYRGRKRKAIIAFSGGVDSTTLASILAPALGKGLLAVTIDAGNLRQGELAEIRRNARIAGVKLRVIEASDIFVKALAKTTDAEEKRSIFQKLYARLLIRAAVAFGGGGVRIFQGTLLPDRIESGDTGGMKIKTHHNRVKFGKLKDLHPIGDLFKYEIRELAKIMNLPEGIWSRKPFPGPGLFIRIAGAPVSLELLDAVRWADAGATAILQQDGALDAISQLSVSFLGGTKLTGVHGDERMYAGVFCVRMVETVDFMTAKGLIPKAETIRRITSKLSEHHLVVGTVFDFTDKPKRTIEPE